MQLRDHPCMVFNGISHWPPAWLRTSGKDITHLAGEIGILKDCRVSRVYLNLCFVTIRYDGTEYVGHLELLNKVCCQRICEVLNAHHGSTLQEIGSLDIP